MRKVLIVLFIGVPAYAGEPARGGRGESCGAASDCEEGLQCVTETCRGENDVPAAASAGPPEGAPLSPTAVDSPEPQRSFGFGTAIGGGFGGREVGANPRFNSAEGTGAFGALLLPTLEAQIFLPREFSVDVTIPVTNIAILSAAQGTFFFNTDVFFNFNLGRGALRLVLGPGLGFSVVAGKETTSGNIRTIVVGTGTLRIPAEVGLEILTRRRFFGFKVLARPWAEVGGGDGFTFGGGGLLGVLVFSFYATR